MRKFGARLAECFDDWNRKDIEAISEHRIKDLTIIVVMLDILEFVFFGCINGDTYHENSIKWLFVRNNL